MWLRYAMPAFVWAGIIAVLSLLPGSNLPVSPFHGFDKLVHAIFYLVLTFLILRALCRFFPLTPYTVLVLMTGIGVFFFGGGIELLQEFLVPGRSGQVSDLFANTAGILGGIYASSLVCG